MNNLYSADLTSYDYGSPIGESGKASFNYYDYRDILQQAYEEPLMDVPSPIPTMQVPNMRFERVAGLFDQTFTVEDETVRPAHFEYYGQNQGMGVYKTVLPVGEGGQLVFTRMSDYVQIYLNG